MFFSQGLFIEVNRTNIFCSTVMVEVVERIYSVLLKWTTPELLAFDINRTISPINCTLHMCICTSNM